jgi:hypothetical protein
MAGYIRLHRGWHDSRQFTQEPYCERAAWCWLLTNAAWKDTTQRNHRGEVVAVGRGQYRTSLRALAAEWQWSIKRVRTFLNVLEKCGSIGTHGAQSGTVITICKYNEYQSGGHEAGTQEGSHGARSGHTKEEGKERKEEKNTARARSFPCPDGVSPEVWADFMAIRKAKRAAVTDTALRQIESEAEKAGWTLEAALTEVVARGWQGFKAEWVKQGPGPRGREVAGGWLDKDGDLLPYA